ncbi:MAG: LysE family transporter [Candidatus Jordarchaeaceae archaeon]
MSLELLLLFGMSFIVGLSGALTPGPLLVVTINKSLEGGFRKGGFTVFGHILLEAPLILLLCLGLGKFLNQDWLKITIALIGGICLITLGGHIIFSVLKKKIEYPLNTIRRSKMENTSELLNPTGNSSEKNLRRRILNNSIILGLTATASNPFYWIWWITVGAAIFQYAPTLFGVTLNHPLYWVLSSHASIFFIIGFDPGYLIIGSVVLSWIFLTIGHFSSDLTWYSLVSFMVSKGRILLNQRRYEIIVTICGASLLILGAWFILSPLLV